MIKKILATILFTTFLSAHADNIYIPDLGTAGVMGLSVQKEESLGNFFIRQARSMPNTVDDPVLNLYVASVGNKLLMNASNVLFPFEFFVVANNELNAAAFLGGKVQVNTGLFIYADTEDEFASVLAHEITHVTQRHIARFIESQKGTQNVSVASIAGSIAMGILNPALGMAAMSTSLGLSMQHSINFTRENEQEADRIGIDLLNKSGFNPQGTVDMFNKLLNMQGKISNVYTMLLTHPLSDERISEARLRVSQLPKKAYSKNKDFYYAKARIDARYRNVQDRALFEKYVKDNYNKYPQSYVNYALALNALEMNKINEAYSYIQKLEDNNNLFIIDCLTDIDLKAHNYKSAEQRLLTKLKSLPNNEVLVVNLAQTYIEQKAYQKAINILNKFLNNTKTISTIALSQLSECYIKTNNKCDGFQNRGELYATKANYDLAIQNYNDALSVCSNNLTREKIKARIAEIAKQRSFDEELKNSL